MAGVTTPVPPVVSASPMPGRLPRLVSGPLSGRLSGLTRWTTGPPSFCACAVFISCEARNRQTATSTAREMLIVLFILVSSRGLTVHARGAEPAYSFLEGERFVVQTFPTDGEGPGEYKASDYQMNAPSDA